MIGMDDILKFISFVLSIRINQSGQKEHAYL